MANPSLFFILLIIIKVASARIIDGLFLNPEVLKIGHTQIHQGNDYVDYSPDSSKGILIQVPDSNVIIDVPGDERTVIEVEKITLDDGSVQENINVERPAAPSVVYEAIPQEVD
uniref:DUF4794 domain-containing protein n=1 Tax=Pectinophora gossypiella TaxID=13191 RepID=A0A1E1WV19_PECGO